MHLQKTYILPGNLQAELFGNFKNLDLGPKPLFKENIPEGVELKKQKD